MQASTDFLQGSGALLELAAGSSVADHEIQFAAQRERDGGVYHARNSRLGRDVHMTLLPAFSFHPERVRRFEQEALAAAAQEQHEAQASYESFLAREGR